MSFPSVRGGVLQLRACRRYGGLKSRNAPPACAPQEMQHLPQVGQVHPVLTEGPRLGRTPQFTEVAFASDQPEGTILKVQITGAANGQLTA